MSKCDQTPGAFFLTLNGYDEIALAKHFDLTLMDLREDGEKHGLAFMRALVFINERRSGLKDGDAYDVAMLLPFTDLRGYFADQDEDELEVDEEGKAPSPEQPA